MAWEKWNEGEPSKRFSPLKAIRAKCLDCSCGNVYEVTKCPIKDCPLYEYRSGHNPALKGKRKGGDPNFGNNMKKMRTDITTDIEGKAV